MYLDQEKQNNKKASFCRFYNYEMNDFQGSENEFLYFCCCN